MAVISEFDFEIMYIKGKENRVVDSLSIRVQVNHIETMSSYGKNLQDWILQVGQQDDMYKDLRHRLQQGIGEYDVDYHLTVDGMFRFRDMIYASENNELKKLILREFHVKPYSGHLGYQKC